MRSLILDAGEPCRFVRSDRRAFSSHRCRIPASEFQIAAATRRYRVVLDGGNFFYLAGI